MNLVFLGREKEMKGKKRHEPPKKKDMAENKITLRKHIFYR
jgi:hypothetical protein